MKQDASNAAGNPPRHDRTFWHRVDVIFNEIAEQPPHARVEAIESMCGSDADLRSEVQRLLASDQCMDRSFLEPPSVAAPLSALNADVSVEGTSIGPYAIHEQIGEGGFGVVYLAEQRCPVRRTVALKIIKSGMDTRQMVARFESERQALALMDHPNIARVFDAGATESGRPYFVMELVRGIAITDYCDQSNLTTVDRVRLFVPVCDAVQHAHQKGVIHRDLKPSNVLIAMQNGRPIPKVIDFGVAKAINQQLTENTFHTRLTQIVGTPLYMSPEQAEMSPLEVDARSDIYCLGALLYELVTGTTLFDRKRLEEASFDEWRRMIREEEPPTPSTRLSTLGEGADAVARHRRTDPRRLRQSVRGDLDWIIMKSLEKDRTRRYTTADALIRDLERYLRNEPVEARPPSTTYRVRKFLRRHRTAAAIAAVALIVSMFGAATTAWKAVDAMRERERAESALRRSERIAWFLQSVLMMADPRQADADASIRDALEVAAAEADAVFAEDPELRADLHALVGTILTRMGQLDAGERHLRIALASRRKILGKDDPLIAETLASLAWSLDVERIDEIEDLFTEALEICRSLSGDSHASVALLNAQLAAVRCLQGRGEEAITLCLEALPIIQRDLGDQHSDVGFVLATLANAYRMTGDTVSAEESYRQAIHVRRVSASQPELAESLSSFARFLEEHDRDAEAQPFHEEAEGIRSQYLGASRHISGDRR